MEKIVYQRLFEDALKLSDTKDFCLYIDTSVSGYVSFILYDPSVMNELITLDRIPQYDKLKNMFKFKFYDSILATITISTSKDNPGVKVPKMAYTIQTTAAKPNTGAGVLLYDIVMSWITKKGKGLTPDRQSISNLAQKVWKYYFTKRNDVEHIPVDDIKNPVTKNKNDDGDLYTGDNIPSEDKDNGYEDRNFVNHIYMMKKPLDYNTLLKNHNNFFKTLIKNLGSKKSMIEDFKKIMWTQSSLFFKQQYQRAK